MKDQHTNKGFNFLYAFIAVIVGIPISTISDIGIFTILQYTIGSTTNLKATIMISTIIGRVLSFSIFTVIVTIICFVAYRYWARYKKKPQLRWVILGSLLIQLFGSGIEYLILNVVNKLSITVSIQLILKSVIDIIVYAIYYVLLAILFYVSDKTGVTYDSNTK